MKNFFLSSILICFLLSACKTDKPEKTEELKPPEKEKLSKNERFLKRIEYAHNADKFNEEEQVKFRIKLKLKDSIFYNGDVVMKTDLSQVRFLSSTIDTVLTANRLKSENDKILYWIAECYAIGFQLNAESFNKISESDSVVVSSFRSPKTSTKFKLSTHPITNIIQKLEYDTGIDQKPFDNGSLNFNRYITVHRIPVALEWTIETGAKNAAEAEITRISYPDKF